MLEVELGHRRRVAGVRPGRRDRQVHAAAAEHGVRRRRGGAGGRHARPAPRDPARHRGVDGTAEAMPIGAGTVDAVTVAQAFHWFDRDAALSEIRRVLRPGGGLGLVWNRRDESVPWVSEMSAVLSWHDRPHTATSRPTGRGLGGGPRRVHAARTARPPVGAADVARAPRGSGPLDQLRGRSRPTTSRTAYVRDVLALVERLRRAVRASRTSPTCTGAAGRREQRPPARPACAGASRTVGTCRGAGPAIRGRCSSPS